MPDSDALDGCNDLGQFGVLEQVAGRTGAYRVDDVVVLRRDGEHQHRHTRVLGQQHPGSFEPRGVRHVHVHDDDVGLERARNAQRDIGVRRVDDLVALRLEECPEARAEEIVVVDDHQAQAPLRAAHVVTFVPLETIGGAVVDNSIYP
jgi:hypothetical protein